MPLVRRTALALLAPAVAAGCATTAPAPGAPAAPGAAPAAVAAGALPRTLAPRPTSAAISAADLMTRVYVFADDSMQGREAGTAGHERGLAYIVGELQRLGAQPAGDGGTFYQTVPMVRRAVPEGASLAVAGQPLARGTDWLAVPPLAPTLAFGGALRGEVPVVYGGRAGDVGRYPSAEQIAGKLVVLSAPAGPNGQPTFNFWSQGEMTRFRGAAGVAVATLELTPPQLLGYFTEPQTMLAGPEAEPGVPAGFVISAAAAERLLGAAPASLQPGAAGRTARGDVAYVNEPTAAPARNVVALLPGSDPALRGTYVVIGAHSDHDGVTTPAVDHDSLRAVNTVMRPRGAEDQPADLTSAQRVRIRAILDSLRAANPPKLDSVYNGADDDASGSMAMLEIAEAVLAAPTRPRRSLLLVWHTAEEKGLFGSEHFGANPTVPRDSIVAALNIDMIGRGEATDLAGGGPGYLQLIGSRRLSTGLGDLVERVNRDTNAGFRFDYTYDAEGHPDQYYCRSDHYNYARWGIPVVFFSTGGHRDYHIPTDEPQYLSYGKYARVTTLIHDIAVAVGNDAARPVVDGAKPDPNGVCRQ